MVGPNRLGGSAVKTSRLLFILVLIVAGDQVTRGYAQCNDVPEDPSEAPVLTALIDSIGPERSVVEVKGPEVDELFKTQVIWDVDPVDPTGSGTPLPGGCLGGYLFSVPQGVTPGRKYAVALKNSHGISNIKYFEVTEPVPFPLPRIDHVMLSSTEFQNGLVTPELYVQGANIDVGAVVLINGNEVPTVAHRALKNELYGTDPEALGYPIYHWVSLIAERSADIGEKPRSTDQ